MYIVSVLGPTAHTKLQQNNKVIGTYNKLQTNEELKPGSSVGIATGYGLDGPGIEVERRER
jgi:hypothetical protein